MKKHNFSAGPCILSQEVFEKSAQAILNFNNSGLSLIEISHRSKDFVAVMDEARRLALELLGLENKGYQALFLQGGASLQFLMTPYNLMKIDGKAAYLDTGTWANGAIKEAKNFGTVEVVASSKAENYQYIPKNLTERPKMGFGIPIVEWCQNDLRMFIHDRFSNSHSRMYDYVREDAAKSILNKFNGGETGLVAQIWVLLMFDLWLEGEGGK
jgi:phosphoserine aminotransferase